MVPHRLLVQSHYIFNYKLLLPFIECNSEGAVDNAATCPGGFANIFIGIFGDTAAGPQRHPLKIVLSSQKFICHTKTMSMPPYEEVCVCVAHPKNDGAARHPRDWEKVSVVETKKFTTSDARLIHPKHPKLQVAYLDTKVQFANIIKLQDLRESGNCQLNIPT